MSRMLRCGALTLVAVLACVSLAGCRDHGLDSAPAGSTPSVAVTATMPSTSPTPVAVSAGATATQQAQQSAALAQLSADLSGIDVGVSQASTDLGAGDSARTQPDEGN